MTTFEGSLQKTVLISAATNVDICISLISVSALAPKIEYKSGSTEQLKSKFVQIITRAADFLGANISTNKIKSD